MSVNQLKWWFWVCWDWFLLLGAFWAINQWLWLLPVMLLVIGCRQHALGVLGHEIVHRTVPISDLLGNLLTMFPLGITVESYRRFHIPHHLFLGTAQDPEIHIKQKFPNTYESPTKYKKFITLLKDYVGINNQEGRFFLKRTFGKITILRVLHTLIFSSILVAVGGWIAPSIWIFSLLSSFWVFNHLRIWREHFLKDGVWTTCKNTPNWLERIYLPHHIGRHFAHHVKGQERIPCWELKTFG